MKSDGWIRTYDTHWICLTFCHTSFIGPMNFETLFFVVKDTHLCSVRRILLIPDQTFLIKWHYFNKTVIQSTHQDYTAPHWGTKCCHHTLPFWTQTYYLTIWKSNKWFCKTQGRKGPWAGTMQCHFGSQSL
jgi:hypothetical protein